jgi:uncharacterized membrane protein (DUF485 family)
MKKTAHEMLETKEFKHLVKKRWTVSMILLGTLFIIYYGFIILIATNKPFITKKIGVVTTIGIPIAVLVIIVSWLLTLIYVNYSNKKYDPEVENLKKQMLD